MLTTPFARVIAVTKSDTVNLLTYPNFNLNCALYVGGAGDVAFVNEDDSVVLIESVPAGTLLPIRPKRINSTNTTASKMALFVG